MQETPLEQHQPPPRMLGFNARPKVAAPEEAAVAPAAVKAKLVADREQSPASVSSQSLASPAFSASQTTLLVPGSAQHETTLGNVSGGSVRTLADGTLPLQQQQQQQQPYPPAGPALRLATGRPASQSLTFVPRPGLSAAMTMASTTAGGQSAAGLHTASSQDIFQSRIAASVLKLVRRMILGRLADDEQVVAEVDTVIVKLYQYCLRILGSRIMPHFLNDEAHIVDLIKKKLMRADPSSERALRFSSLVGKLGGQQVLKQRWAILYFLYSIGQDATSQQWELPSNVEDSFLSLRAGTAVTANPAPRAHETAMRKIAPAYPTQILSAQNAPVTENVSAEVPETVLLREILYAYQGIDGKHIHWDETKGQFNVDAASGIPRSMREMIRRLLELASLFKKVHASMDALQKNEAAGLLNQSFCAAVTKELGDYYRFVSNLESHLMQTSATGRLTMKRLLVWTEGPLQRLRLLLVIVESCNGFRGGALLNQIYSCMEHGDPFVHALATSLLDKTSKLFFETLSEWIQAGKLNDPHKEFFIVLEDANAVDLWRQKFSLRADNVPRFISPTIVDEIFLIGKSIDFIRMSCGETVQPSSENFAGLLQEMTLANLPKLEALVDKEYKRTSRRLLKLMYEKYDMATHLRALKSYLLLGQGDFIQLLMDSLSDELDRPAKSLYRHNLTSMMESAIRGSNAQYDNPDVLKRLDVRLLEVTERDSGWDVFSLDYHVDGPISTVLTPDIMNQYLRIFNFLWRLKRAEFTLSQAWARQMTFARSLKTKACLVSFQMAVSEMVYFIYQLQHYILFEVLECSWNELESFIKSGEGDMAALIHAHEKYLSDLSVRGLLGTIDKEKSVMMTSVTRIFKHILKFCQGHSTMYDMMSREEERIAVANKKSEKRTDAGKWGATAQDEESNLQREKEHMLALDSVREDLAAEGVLFRSELLRLLGDLSSNPDASLRFLSFRLNYNNFYSEKELLAGGPGKQ